MSAASKAAAFVRSYRAAHPGAVCNLRRDDGAIEIFDHGRVIHIECRAGDCANIDRDITRAQKAAIERLGIAGIPAIVAYFDGPLEWIFIRKDNPGCGPSARWRTESGGKKGTLQQYVEDVLE